MTNPDSTPAPPPAPKPDRNAMTRTEVATAVVAAPIGCLALGTLLGFVGLTIFVLASVAAKVGSGVYN